MSKNNKNKPASTISKLIDYFNDDEEEEEEDEEEIYTNQKNDLSSLGVSGKISRLYSYRDENEIQEEQNENENDNNINNSINKEKNENKIFTHLYANEQPDSSFFCEEHPKGENKITNNNNEFIGRAVSFHKKNEESENKEDNKEENDDKNKISYGFREDNKEISKISKENTFTNTGINYIDNETSFSKEKINLINSDYNNKENNITNINNENKPKEKEEKENNSIYINNGNKSKEEEEEKENNNTKEDINNNKINNDIENINDNNKIDSFNNSNNISNYNIIYNNDKTSNINNKDNDSMINITKNNGYLMDYEDEKTLEEQENEFLELERQRKEKEKIKKKKEKLLEELRLKQEEKKALEKKLEEKRLKDLNNKIKKNTENINNNSDNEENDIEIQNANDNTNTNIQNINNELNGNNNTQIVYNINNNEIQSNIEENNKENTKQNELINSINYQKFDSFKNINNLFNNNNTKKSNDINKIPQSNININTQINKKLFNPEYLIDSSTFDAIQNGKNSFHQNNHNNNNHNDNNKKRTEESKKNMNDKENKNMKILKNLVNLNLNQEKHEKNKKILNNNKYQTISEYNTYKNPIELILYDDALKRRQKLENIDKTVMKGIKLNSNKTKITNASYKVAIERDEKIIEKIINKYSILNKKNNTKYINIIGIAFSLRDMKIFRQLFKNDKYNINNTNQLIALKKIILSTGKKEIRKINEINFLQQTWLLLNKEENKEYINKDIFLGLLKIIFSPEGTIKEIENLLNKYLEAVLIGMNLFNNKNNNDKNINNIKLNKNKNNILTTDILISPIDNKKISYENLWPLSKYLKVFFDLKKNIIAYKTTDNMNNLKKEKLYDKISKHQKIKSSILNTNYYTRIEDNPISKKKLNQEKIDSNFDKLYQKFLEKEKYRKIVLEEMRKKKEMDELKELKPKPTISKFRGNTITEKEFSLLGKQKEDIHDRLYKMDKDIKAKRQELIEEKEKLEKEKIKNEQKRNKLRINSRLSKLRMNKSFDHPQKCKGFDEFVTRNRKGRLERLRVKYLLEKTSQGERYEEIMRRNITPPNITDIRRMRQKEEKKNIKENNSNESDGNDEYFNLQIKLPNGKMKTLKVYENDDPNEVVEEFCKIHSIDDNIKSKLVANIENCQRQFLMKNNESNENDIESNPEENEEEEYQDEQNNILVDEEN